MKRLLLLPVLALALLTGCKSTPMNKALFVTTVSTGVAFGVERYPEATPYLRVAAPILCAAAEGTNVAPAQVVALIQNSPAAEAASTPTGKLILNGSLVLYISLFETYGSGVADQEQLQQYLRWTCEAINLGLPLESGAARSGRPLPPHVR